MSCEGNFGNFTSVFVLKIFCLVLFTFIYVLYFHASANAAARALCIQAVRKSVGLSLNPKHC